MIKMVTKSIEDKIHIDDLRSLEMVSIDRLVNQGSDRLEDRERKKKK